MSIFEDRKDYSLFLNLLQETIETFHIKVAAFCLMRNHNGYVMFLDLKKIAQQEA